MRIKIYRIEKKSYAYGPYGMDYKKWAEKNHVVNPSPMVERLVPTKKALKPYRCGFNSLSQLKKWFDKGELKNLSEIGYQLKVFEVVQSKVILGKKQILFKMKAKRFNCEYLDILSIIK